MAKIHGTVRDYIGKPLENAEILYLDRTYSVLGSGYSNADGEYYVQIDGKHRGMINSTSDYGEKFLGYWFMDLYSDTPHKMDIILGNVEFVFFKQENVNDSMNFSYSFRLLSLEQLLTKDEQLSPKSDLGSFRIMIGGNERKEVTLKRRGQVFLEVTKQNMDEYVITFRNTGVETGKVMEICYENGENRGMIGTIIR